MAFDIAGSFPVTDSGNKYIIVVMDYFSKWSKAYGLPNRKPVTVSSALMENWICRYGIPLEMHSDQGRNFESNVFPGVCELLGVRKTRRTPLHPRSDGMVERFNRIIEQHLSKRTCSTTGNAITSMRSTLEGQNALLRDVIRLTIPRETDFCKYGHCGTEIKKRKLVAFRRETPRRQLRIFGSRSSHPSHPERGYFDPNSVQFGAAELSFRSGGTSKRSSSSSKNYRWVDPFNRKGVLCQITLRCVEDNIPLRNISATSSYG
ncbi:hypothetical protein GEV33_004787 [Tenebrio molitor]|uniref:Integrase catalytic domain-containing protein n=1 Tax=Tenebrio molitor TaxID=7067 RepID=A0A8J6LD49_TENMO|nr:hypothetical protein GEV33_004787 [Tenebrio molitor]